ncbi:MAG: GntR family transcriptional regulator [Pseudomonadota bacterium]
MVGATRQADETRAPRQSAVARIEHALRNDIAAGFLAPGQRLDEVSLTKRFDVSRTPVREALSRLVAQGVLVPGVKRGVQVADYTKPQLSQIFEAMHEIEAACARIAAQRLTLLSRTEITVAQRACAEAAEAGDIPAYLRANEQFHDTIYRATGNPYIAEIASDFRRRTGPFRASKFQSREDLLQSARSHESLIALIFSEDSQAASDGMRAHMTESFLQTFSAR